MKKLLNSILKKNFDIALTITGLAIIMLGLSYISVPLYQIFCQTYGIGGTVQKTYIENIEEIKQEQSKKDLNIIKDNKQIPLFLEKNKLKSLTIQFSANSCSDLPWELKPTISKMKVYPGDSALTFYVASNSSNETLTGVATYNVTPPKAGIYFNKIQCFCFEEQRLKGKEIVELPILFFIDSDFYQDPKMKDIDTIILSYTFFKTA